MDIVERLRKVFGVVVKADDCFEEDYSVAREAADEIERLRQQNAELVEALRCFLALETPHTWLYKRNKAEALVKESLSTELFNELQSNRG